MEYECCASAQPWVQFGVEHSDGPIIALAGNPNVGKTTIFNALTGMRQHTGNWPGKTVKQARGSYLYRSIRFTVVDLPGTFSLLSHSSDEQVARDFLVFGRPSATIIVVDATRLERNLNLALQVLEITDRAVVALNMIDEARNKMEIDVEQLQKELGVPVVPTVARRKKGLDKLMQTVYELTCEGLPTSPLRLTYPRHIEEAVQRVEPLLKEELPPWVNARWLALRLVEGDVSSLRSLARYAAPAEKRVTAL